MSSNKKVDVIHSPRKLTFHITVVTPDGDHFSVWVYEGESFKGEIKKFIDHWYEITNEKPEKFGHIILPEKCPKCGHELHAKKYDDCVYVWCPHKDFEERREFDA